MWYYYDNNLQKQGPVTDAQMKVMAVKGYISPETIIETEIGEQGKAYQISGLEFGEPIDAPKRQHSVSPFIIGGICAVFAAVIIGGLIITLNRSSVKDIAADVVSSVNLPDVRSMPFIGSTPQETASNPGSIEVNPIPPQPKPPVPEPDDPEPEEPEQHVPMLSAPEPVSLLPAVPPPFMPTEPKDDEDDKDYEDDNLTQEERKKYAEDLFSALSDTLNPESDSYIFSSRINTIWERNGGGLEIICNKKGLYNSLLDAANKQDYLTMISVLNNDYKYKEYPPKGEIDKAFAKLDRDNSLFIGLEMYVPLDISAGSNIWGMIFFYDFDTFNKTGKFADIGHTKWQNYPNYRYSSMDEVPMKRGRGRTPNSKNYYADWSYQQGKRCFLICQPGLVRNKCDEWNGKLKEALSDKRKAVRDGKLTPDEAEKEIRNLYDETLAEAVEWCKNDGVPKSEKPKNQPKPEKSKGDE